MKKILIAVFALWMLWGSAGLVLAQEAEVVDVPVSRFALLMENWKDRLAVWVERDEAKKADLEARIAEKYQSWEERIDNLPENANREGIRQVMEQRKMEYTKRLEVRVEEKQEIRSRFETRLNELQERGDMVRERVEMEEEEEAEEVEQPAQQGRRMGR